MDPEPGGNEPSPTGPPAGERLDAPQAGPPAQQWAPAAPAAPAFQPQWVYTEPLEYHRLLRGTPRYRWWKPLVALVLGIVYYVAFSVAFGLAVMLPYFALSGASFTEDSIYELAIPDTQNPASLIMTLGSVILMIPAAILAVLSVGLTPSGRLWSVALRIRWGLIARTLLPALVALVVMNGVGILLEAGFSAVTGAGDENAPVVDIDATVALWSALILILLVPAQCAAEELVYRGMFMQVLGAWFGAVPGSTGVQRFLRGPWPVIVLPAIAFGFSHIYDWWGWGAVVAMALVAGWLSWRSGGLEAAISLHVVNNLVAFTLMLFGAGGETGQTESGGGAGALIGSVIGLVLYAWWVDRDFRRRGVMRTRIDSVELRARSAAPGAAQAPVPPSPGAHPGPYGS